jgi:dihydrofolate reductase
MISLQRPLFAIAAMSGNHVIGTANRLPWHLPEDFKFFKKTTLGHVLVMGRKTYESIGRPLPGRTTVVFSRSAIQIPGTHVVADWEALRDIEPDKKLFIAGGADLYAQALPQCSLLYLTHVHATPTGGDAFFPPFEHLFDAGEILEEHPDFTIRLHRRLPENDKLLS